MSSEEESLIQEKVNSIFKKANFISDLGIKLKEVHSGFCETFLIVKEKHLQQNGFIHAGVQATIADHTAGGAAMSVVGENKTILSIEFKINLLRPAKGEKLFCEATVLKSGKNIVVTEAEVYTSSEGSNKLVSKAIVTLAVVEDKF